MGTATRPSKEPKDLPITLDRDSFLRDLLRHLSGTLEEVVGVEEASGFISIVGQRLGDEIGQKYRAALSAEKLSSQQVTATLVDLKQRIQGDFYVIEQNDEKVVLGNRRCPFGDQVLGRPSLCMMTSNVFGAIAAENLGYAKVVIEQAIARGHPECRIIVHFEPTPEADESDGREYFGS